MENVARLFGEAWAHQRRRRRLTWETAGLVALAVAGIAVFGSHRAASPRSLTGGIRVPPETVREPPGKALAKTPIMAVACPKENSIACDRVMLWIKLRRPARSAVATIDGRRLALDWHGDLRPLHPLGPRRELNGFLWHAGIRTRMHIQPFSGTNIWWGGHEPGQPEPSARVWLLIDYGHGRHVLTHLRVPLGPGYG